MADEQKNSKSWLSCSLAAILLIPMQLAWLVLFAQGEKTAEIKLDFLKTDTTRVCQATVTSEGKPVAGPEVHLYVKRMYSLLPVGKTVATDSTGVANIDFPMDLPGDKQNMITVIAKIENDETYGNVEKEAKVQWGVAATNQMSDWNTRSLSASREKAPMFLVIASVAIIAVIWGTIVYVISQLFRINKSSKAFRKRQAVNQ